MADATLSGHDHERPGFFTRWFMSTNHKDIGILYLFTAGFVGLISVAFTVYMRMELMEPGVQYMYLAFESSPAALESLFGRVGEAMAAAGGGTNAFADQLSSLQATLMARSRAPAMMRGSWWTAHCARTSSRRSTPWPPRPIPAKLRPF
jgi:hypothetical protein